MEGKFKFLLVQTKEEAQLLNNYIARFNEQLSGFGVPDLIVPTEEERVVLANIFERMNFGKSITFTYKDPTPAGFFDNINYAMHLVIKSNKDFVDRLAKDGSEVPELNFPEEASFEEITYDLMTLILITYDFKIMRTPKKPVRVIVTPTWSLDDLY